MQRGKVQSLAKALEKIMYASGLGSVAHVTQRRKDRDDIAGGELVKNMVWVVLFAVAVVLFGVFLIWKKYKKLEKRMEENELALRFQILGLSSAKDEIEEARHEFKSYVINQGQF